MICKYCGSSNDDNLKICSVCGMKLIEDESNNRVSELNTKYVDVKVTRFGTRGTEVIKTISNITGLDENKIYMSDLPIIIKRNVILDEGIEIKHKLNSVGATCSLIDSTTKADINDDLKEQGQFDEFDEAFELDDLYMKTRMRENESRKDVLIIVVFNILIPILLLALGVSSCSSGNSGGLELGEIIGRYITGIIWFVVLFFYVVLRLSCYY